jgi:hypothetical protein
MYLTSDGLSQQAAALFALRAGLLPADLAESHLAAGSVSSGKRPCVGVPRLSQEEVTAEVGQPQCDA